MILDISLFLSTSLCPGAALNLSPQSILRPPFGLLSWSLAVAENQP
jgi:hypothetical protein